MLLCHPEVAEPQPNRSTQDLNCHPELDSGSIHRGDEGSPLTPTLSRRARGKRVAFTLAEVLITLAIIGVVAAMTIPTLISDYQEKVTVTRVKKIYSTFINAHKLIRIENGSKPFTAVYDESKTATENTEAIVNLFKPYFRISKDCGFEPGCLTSGRVKSLSNTNNESNPDYDNRANEYKMILNDGTALWFYSATEKDEETRETHIAMNIKVDVDGFAGPYQWGKDIFLFNVKDNAIAPDGQNSAEEYYKFEEWCKTDLEKATAGLGCTAWVIQIGNMDYLHCDDLSWSGKHKCSD